MGTLEQRVADIEQSVAMLGLTQKEVLTFDEASRYTGLSKSWLYKLTATKQIPHYKPSGKLCYFDRAELDAWVKQNRVSTTEEIETAAQSYCLKNGSGSRNVKSAK
ncbi:MAG: helix-turn-helix domain-containing protein [Rikenellaceae bacterium]